MEGHVLVIKTKGIFHFTGIYFAVCEHVNVIVRM
jgi:hypothetical protein